MARKIKKIIGLKLGEIEHFGRVCLYRDMHNQFDCVVVACGIAGYEKHKIMIMDINTLDRGWCSPSLVDDGEIIGI